MCVLCVYLATNSCVCTACVLGHELAKCVCTRPRTRDPGRSRQRHGPKIPGLVLHVRHRRKGEEAMRSPCAGGRRVRGRHRRPPSVMENYSESSLSPSLPLSQTVHPALARRWFRAAAAQGDVTSEFCMGFCWYDGGWSTFITYLLLYWTFNAYLGTLVRRGLDYF